MDDFLYQAELNELEAMIQRHDQKAGFQPASEAELDWLAEQGIPDSVRQFYEFAEPSRVIESEGVYLIPIAKIADVNQHVMPGAVTSQFGYIVIAETVSGDAFCVNTHCLDADGQPPIYFINHDRLGSDATIKDLRNNSRLVTPTFRQFLRRFAAGTLPYDYYFMTIGENQRGPLPGSSIDKL
jgi:hypothetical protein